MPDLITRRPTPTLEAAIEGLRAQGLDPRRVDVVPVGPIEGYKGPIVDQDPKPGETLEPRDRVVLFVREYGLADRLPEGVLENTRQPRDAANRLLEMGRDDYWAQYIAQFTPGRRFVLALDHELATLDVAIGRARATLRPIGDDADFGRALLGLYDIGDLDVDAAEANLLAALLFAWPDRKGPVSALTDLLEALMGVDVRVRELPGEWLEVPEAERSPLGAASVRLGENVTVGSRFRSAAPKLAIELGPVDVRRFHRLDADPRFRARVDTLCELCLPASQSFDWKLLLDEPDRKCELGDAMHARLGRTSHLGG